MQQLCSRPNEKNVINDVIVCVYLEIIKLVPRHLIVVGFTQRQGLLPSHLVLLSFNRMVKGKDRGR